MRRVGRSDGQGSRKRCREPIGCHLLVRKCAIRPCRCRCWANRLACVRRTGAHNSRGGSSDDGQDGRGTGQLCRGCHFDEGIRRVGDGARKKTCLEVSILAPYIVMCATAEPLSVPCPDRSSCCFFLWWLASPRRLYCSSRMPPQSNSFPARGSTPVVAHHKEPNRAKEILAVLDQTGR